MSKITDYYAGDTGSYVVKLRIGTTPYSVSPSNTVTARFINQDTQTVITAAVSQSSSAEGADWANGAIGVEFDATNANLLQAHAGQTRLLEIEVTKSTKTRTFQVLMNIKQTYTP
jgi:hypothetical protein